VAGSDEQKRTNGARVESAFEIGMAIPLLETCEIAGKDIPADALLTQRAIAKYVVCLASTIIPGRRQLFLPTGDN
jgi:hypothetical protein